MISLFSAGGIAKVMDLLINISKMGYCSVFFGVRARYHREPMEIAVYKCIEINHGHWLHAKYLKKCVNQMISVVIHG